MPAKNTLKIYVENAHYHIYNRGVEKRIIFQDEQDYSTFLSYLKTYLTPPPDVFHRLNNFHGEITLSAYCLMPNHFHLLVKQNSKSAINYFMRSLATKYSMYFNAKYKRVGTLFQGRYKALQITTDSQLLHLTKYIHLNPTSTTRTVLAQYPYSSYRNYLGAINQTWINPKQILDSFYQRNQDLFYKSFVEETELDFGPISHLTLE